MTQPTTIVVIPARMASSRLSRQAARPDPRPADGRARAPPGAARLGHRRRRRRDLRPTSSMRSRLGRPCGHDRGYPRALHDRVEEAMRCAGRRHRGHRPGRRAAARAGRGRAVAQPLRDRADVVCTNLLSPLESRRRSCQPEIVKAACARDGRVMFFSRAPIPFYRGACERPVYRQTGIMGFRADLLRTLFQPPGDALRAGRVGGHAAAARARGADSRGRAWTTPRWESMPGGRAGRGAVAARQRRAAGALRRSTMATK